MSRIFEEIVKKRGIDEAFLNPKYLSDGELPDIKKVAERMILAAKRQEKIMIYGDYDADGVTASMVMHDALELMGVQNIIIMLPDRFKDGYGMSMRAVERAKKEGVRLVITVDCGSNNAEVVAELKKNGIDTIVTDHHEISGEMPECVAVVNPKRKDFSGREDLRNLAGVGVAFMVARELVRRGAIANGQEKWMLDLVLIGTVCDSMVITGVNRELCYYGMIVLEKTRRLGLIELMRVAGVKKISTEAVGFQIGPRINAAGRMASAEVALKLLMTKSAVEALALAKGLEDLNSERKTQQMMAVDEVTKQGVGDEPVVVVAGNWHEGVLGIIAGRLTEEYLRPAFVLSEVEKGVLKGSGRSFGDFSLAEALLACNDEIIGGGGHAGACGVKLETGKLDAFRKKLTEYYDSLKLVEQEKYLLCGEDMVVSDFGELDEGLFEELKRLEPYGVGNEEPIFLLSEAFVLGVQHMGEMENHLKLELRGDNGVIFKAVAFYAPKDWLEVREGERVDVWVKLMLNEWNGKRMVEGKLMRVERK